MLAHLAGVAVALDVRVADVDDGDDVVAALAEGCEFVAECGPVVAVEVDVVALRWRKG